MDAETFQRIEAVFQEIRDLDPGDRTRILNARTADADDVRVAVRSMLSADGDDGAVLDRRNDLANVTRAVVDSIETTIGGARLGSRATDDSRRSTPPDIPGYDIREELGQGGMGVVYRAEQRNPKRPAAIKLIHPALAGGSAMKRFEREAAMLARLDHPGIARIFEAGHVLHHGVERPFIAMEYVDGMPIGTWVSRFGATSDQIIDRLADIADAVAHAHERGIIHRDLKPANILVQPDGAVRVLDFGAGRFTGGDHEHSMHTQTGQLIGTLPYMAPEQLDGTEHRIGAWTDVYALGILAFRLLTGELPLDVSGQPLVEAARIIRDEEPSSLGRIDARLRGDIDTVVMAALEKDPRNRYSDAGAMAADLRRVLRGHPIAARRPSALENVKRFAVRNRGLVASVLAVVAVTTAGFVSTSVLLVRADRERVLRTVEAERADSRAARASLAAALGALQSRLPNVARNHLNDVPPDRRTFAWKHLAARVMRAPAAYRWPGEGFRDAKLIDDGRTMVTSGRSGVIRYFDVESKSVVREIANTDGREICALAFDESRRWLLAVGWGLPHVWDMTQPDEPPRILEGRPRGRTIVMDDVAGEAVFIDMTGVVHVYRMDDWSRVAMIPTGYPSPEVMVELDSVEGRHVLIGSYRGPFTQVDLASRTVVDSVELDAPGMKCFTHDAERDLLAIGFFDGRIAVCARPDFMERGLEGCFVTSAHAAEVTGLTWQADGSLLSFGNDEPLTRWQINRLSGDQWIMQDPVALGSVASHLFRVHHDRRLDAIVAISSVGLVELIDPRAPQEPIACEHPRQVVMVEVDSSSTYAYSAGGRHPTTDGHLRQWNVETGTLERTFEPALGPMTSLSLSSDGTRVVGCGFTRNACWDTETGDLVWLHNRDRRHAATHDPGGDLLWIRRVDGIMESVDLETGDIIDEYATDIEFAPYELDGRLSWTSPTTVLFTSPTLGPVEFDTTLGTYRIMIASMTDGLMPGTDDSSPRRWAPNAFWTSAVDPITGNIAVGRANGVIDVFSKGFNEKTATVQSQQWQIRSITFGPDGSLVVGGHHSDLEFLDPDSGALILSIPAHATAVNAFAVAPDGSFLVSAGSDRQMRIWNCVTSEEWTRFEQKNPR